MDKIQVHERFCLQKPSGALAMAQWIKLLATKSRDLEFDLWDLAGRREATPESDSLTFTC